MLQTKAGGYAMITTTSSRLFDFISSEDPVSQILLTGFATHQHLLKNGGLFVTSLTCKYDTCLPYSILLVFKRLQNAL